MTFEEARAAFFEPLGDHAAMVLATALRDEPSARMMSVLVMPDGFYLQTDDAMRKTAQLRGNPRAALCRDNLSVECDVTELGRPSEHPDVMAAYARCFPSAYRRYAAAPYERLFRLAPRFAKRWVYLDDAPYEETLDFAARVFRRVPYDAMRGDAGKR